MKGIYNPKKLTTDRERFHKIRVLNIGAGAVGSAAVEHEAKLCLSLDVIDDDRFEPDNAAKRSCLVRTPEDDGSNKALCLGHRVQPLLDDGCTANGIDANLRLLGPEALADYDVIVCAVDNNAAKVLLNELVRRLPEERRPVVIMDGTHIPDKYSIKRMGHATNNMLKTTYQHIFKESERTYDAAIESALDDLISPDK